MRFSTNNLSYLGNCTTEGYTTGEGEREVVGVLSLQEC